MQLFYLKNMKKWLTKYQGKAVGVGDTPFEALATGLATLNPDKFVWDKKSLSDLTN